MVVRLYCVFDRVAQLCGPIADAVNDGVAWRQFVGAMKDNPNRSDFQLLFVGTFDQSKGLLFPVDPLPVVVENNPPLEKDGQIVLDLVGGNGRA